ncbi:MAG: Rne/Rng family ribonuclease [Thermostichales cyanobacterium HHBFW_bins_127]
MSKQIVIAEQYRIAAVFSEDQIQELIVASGEYQVGDVYLGVVENILPSIDAAFVNLGNSERNGFIHVSDLGPLRLKRNSAAISELLAPQQKVLVQVMKEPTGNKGPRLTGNLSFPGRYVVMMPFQRGVHLSRRIRDEEERNRLKSLAILIKPSNCGLLVRTEAEGVSEEAILDDLEQLKKQWEHIQQQQASSRAPSLLNRDDDFIQRVLRDVYGSDVNRIVTDSPTGVKRVRQALQSWNQGQMPPGVVVDAYRDPGRSILEYFRVNAAIRQALRPRVDLPSGGYIIIEPTEALTVIDVNSGSFTQSATSRETVLWTNCEAASEIARQLRLRNIAGVIVVDFIDMESRRDQLQVLEHFHKALRADKARPQIAQLSELGLVELTRKRQGQSLYEIFGRPCPACEGLGIHVHLPGSPEEQEEPEEVVVVEEPRPVPTGVRIRNGKTRQRPARVEVEEAEAAPAPLRLDPLAGVGGRGRERQKPALRPEAEKPAASKERRQIVVPMTPLQQQVYGEMGLSPALLLEEPVEAGTVITVTLPGEAAATEAVPAPIAEVQVGEALPIAPVAVEETAELPSPPAPEPSVPQSPPAARRKRRTSAE